ncbi:MAG TPA: CoA transferase [Nitrososphaerales archaeon]|nr:CoA transferase [Nitrososphaerales archaeon]
MTAHPLQGLKVLDLTQFVSGPFCTQILADLGARVVKIERPGSGDPYRNAGPSFVDGESTLFLSLTRSKESVALNLKSSQGRDIFLHKLLPRFDILVENFSPGTMESLGIGYDECRKVNAPIIYSGISGFGIKGPMREKKGFDLILQAVSGIMDLTGESDSEPVKVGVPITDFAAGLFSAVGILAAVHERHSILEGTKITTSLYESSVALLSILACDYLASGNVPHRMGSASPTFAPYQAFEAKDAYIAVAGAGSEEMWIRFVQAIDFKELAKDPRFLMNADRVKHQKELADLINGRLRKKSAEEWLGIFDSQGVPSGLVGTLPEVVINEQSKALELVGKTPLRNFESKAFSSVRLPLSFEEQPVVSKVAPPGLGEHTESNLLQAGLTMNEIGELRRNGVVG